MTKLNILFVGNNRVGKTTFSRVLEELLMRGCRYKVYRVSFGTGLRQELVEHYGIPEYVVFNSKLDKNKAHLRLGAYPYDPSIVQRWIAFGLVHSIKQYEATIITLRDLLITHGTDVRRSEDVHYWSHVLRREIEELPKHDILICDDCRYGWDFEFFKDQPFFGFHLVSGADAGSDKAQSAAEEMVQQNQEHFQTIEVPVPLLDYTAEQIIRAEVLPKILKYTPQPDGGSV